MKTYETILIVTMSKSSSSSSLSSPTNILPAAKGTISPRKDNIKISDYKILPSGDLLISTAFEEDRKKLKTKLTNKEFLITDKNQLRPQIIVHRISNATDLQEINEAITTKTGSALINSRFLT